MEERTLYRAVSLAEAEDIRKIGAFRSIPGSMETKLFVTSELDAARLGRHILYRIDRQAICIAAVRLPRNLFEALLSGAFRSDFQTRTIGVDPRDLAIVNAVGDIEILSFCQIPD